MIDALTDAGVWLQVRVAADTVLFKQVGGTPTVFERVASIASERPGLSGPCAMVGSSSGERTGYCSRRMTASSASSVAGAASLIGGCCAAPSN